MNDTANTGPATRHVFLLMGQSNMAGYGCVKPDDPWQPGDTDPVAGVLVLGGQGTVRASGWWRPARWRPAAHPLHRHQNSSRFGPGIDFARRYREASPGVEVGLVPCAWGGAPISRLGRGTPIFRNALRRARVARRSGELRGVLWHQGESDCRTPALVGAYEARLRRLVADLRSALGQPLLPWIIGDLAPFYEDKARRTDPSLADRFAEIRAILRRVADSDPRAAFVETSGLRPPPGDHVHFNRDSCVILGRRYADALLALDP